MTAVKDQGGCGSCVAFGVVGVLESTLRVTARNPGLDVDLSEAHLFFCHGRSHHHMDVDETEFESTQQLAVGEELCVRLPENPTTGYRWRVTSSGDGCLDLLGDGFEPGGPAASPGAAGVRVLRYIARKAGTVALSAVSERAWQTATAGAHTLTLVIR